MNSKCCCITQTLNLVPVLKEMKAFGTSFVYETYDMDKLLNPVCHGDYSENCKDCPCYRKDRKNQCIPCERKQIKRNNIKRGCNKLAEICKELGLEGRTLTFEDGSHIVYVNGNYKGDDEIGQLMNDFHQTDPDNMHYEELAQGVKHFKEVEEGRETMCETVQEYAEKSLDLRWKRHSILLYPAQNVELQKMRRLWYNNEETKGNMIFNCGNTDENGDKEVDRRYLYNPKIRKSFILCGHICFACSISAGTAFLSE